MEHTNNSYAKRTKIFGIMIFLMTVILSSLVFINALPVFCYQESANVVNQSGTDGSCALNYTGYYNVTNNTGASGASNNFIYMTYKIPPNASAAIWQVKHGNFTTPYNVTIPRTCFNYDGNWLRLRFTSLHQIGGVYNSYSYGQCLDTWNSTWINITRYSYISNNSATTISSIDNSSKAFDGDWNTKTGWYYDTLQSSPTNLWNPTLSGASANYSLIYEEGIYWILGPSVYLNTPANNSLQLYNNVNISCSTNDSNLYIRNVTLFTDSSGIWSVNKTTFGNVGVYDNFTVPGSICQPNQFIGPTCANQRWSVYILVGNDYGGSITEPGDGNVYLSASGSSNHDIGLAEAQLNSQSTFYQYAINVTYAAVSAENAWPLSGVVFGRIRLMGGGTLLTDAVACSQFLSDCSSFTPVYNDFTAGYWSINYTGVGNVWNLYKDGVLLRTYTTSGEPQGMQVVADAFAGTGHSRHSGASITFRDMTNIQDNYLTENPATFTNFYPAGLSNINWNCKSCNTQGMCYMSPVNYTFSVDGTLPTVNVTSPKGLISYAFIGQTVNLNWSIYDNGNIDTCWYSYMGVNTTVSCNLNTTTFQLGEQKYLTFYVNDTANNVGSDTTNWTYSVIEHTMNHSEYSYETSSQSFVLNASSDTINSAYLSYYTGSGYANYTATSIVNYTGYNIISTSFDIPLITGSSPVNRSFYWVLNTTSGTFNTTTHYQNTFAINLSSPCQNPVNITYLNISYKDEMHYNYINGSVQASSFYYWLGNGTVRKYLFYNNDTIVSNFPFCFYPGNQSLFLLYGWQAASPGYVVRNFQTFSPLALTSIPTNKIFWMISLSESAVVAVTVIDSLSGNVVPDARVTITRDIQGNTEAVLDGYTDGAGTISTWLSTVVPYTITAVKSGCGSNTRTIVPVQGTYQMNLNCQSGADGNGSSNLSKYVSAFNGVSYQRGPQDGITNPSNYSFTYYITSMFYPIVAAKFTLVDQEGNVVASKEGFAINGTNCNSSSCYLSLYYSPVPGDNIKGNYYVNLGNGITNGTYALLESDAYWRFIIINQNNSQQAWTKFVIHLNEFLTVWGGNETNCIPYNTNYSCALQPDCKWVPNSAAPEITGGSTSTGICVLKDDSNKAEFNRIIIIFFGMVIILFIMGKFIGFELTNPGSFVSYMAIIIVILSMGGLFNFAGLTGSIWFNKYIYAIICVEIAVGYNIAIIRRYSM